MNSWIVTVYPSSPREPICSTCHSFLFLFRLPQTCLFSVIRRMFLEKKDAYPTSAPGPCSQILVEFELLIYFCFTVRIFWFFMFFIVSAFPVLSTSSLNYILLSTARILVPLIILGMTSVKYQDNHDSLFWL